MLDQDELCDYLKSIGLIARKPAWSRTVRFYRASWETYFQLKQLRRWYWRTVYARARWARWQRKTVKREGPEPEGCPVFFGFGYRRGGLAGGLTDKGICALFDDVRRPYTTAVSALPSKEVARIQLMYDTARLWFQERGEPDPMAAREKRRERRLAVLV